MHKISSKLPLTETFKLGCDIELEHSNPIFSLDTSLLMMIYHQIEFGCKRLIGSEPIKDIVETISPHCDLYLVDRIQFISHDIPTHGSAPQYQARLQKVAKKHSAEWEQIIKRASAITGQCHCQQAALPPAICDAFLMIAEQSLYLHTRFVLSVDSYCQCHPCFSV